VTDPAVAVKLAVVAPAATDTEAGTVTAALLLDTATDTPELADDKVTVQADVPPETTDTGAHCSDVTVGAVTVTEALVELPFNDAVSVAV